MAGMALGIGIGLAFGAGGGVRPPAGFVFLVEVDNGTTYYLVDSDGYYLVEAI